ncbi:MAG: tetratricopeptide repeat protein [Fimbriimonas sp.]|nr:tetratricopeptide repeat protein [Fimbriimonas sp.]
MNLRLRCLIGGLTTIIGALALACMSAYEESVHFKGVRVDFGAPPTRYAMNYAELPGFGIGWRPGTEYYGRFPGDEDLARRHEENRTHRLFGQAIDAETHRDYVTALAIWIRCQKYGVGEPGPVRRRIDLLRILVRQPNLRLASTLLRATRLNKPIGLLPERWELDSKLAPFAQYAKALRIKVPRQGAAAFRQIADEYPHSPLAEPSLITVPRLLLCEGAKPNSADYATAGSALDRLLAVYPKSRFTFDALGWKARVLFLHGKYLPALLDYRKQFAMSTPAAGAEGPLDSIILCEEQLHRRARVAAAYVLRYGLTEERKLRFDSITALADCFASFSSADGKAFWRLLKGDPKLLPFYLDYRLDNTTKLTGLLDLAERNDEAVLGSPYRARFLARAAEAAYRLRSLQLAARYARQALDSRPSNDDAARAEFVLGAVARRYGRPNEAILHFVRIVRRYGSSYLVGGARENLALLYEHLGRLGEALDAYRALKYDYDVAYLLDVRMKPSEIVEYLTSHKHLADRVGIVYSLGLRYLRKHQWSLAEKTLAKVPQHQRDSYRKTAEPYQFDEVGQQDPLVSVRDLAKLDGRIQSASSGGAKASATFAMADYYYGHRNLMLYNGWLWKGLRAIMFAYQWNAGISTPKDDDAVWTHHWEHECLAQSLLLCRKIVAEYRHPPIRYRAAYLGACAAARLSRFNEYWRWQSEQTNLNNEAVRLMKIARKSPNPRLAAKARKFAAVFAEGVDTSKIFDEGRHANRYKTGLDEPETKGDEQTP